MVRLLEIFFLSAFVYVASAQDDVDSLIASIYTTTQKPANGGASGSGGVDLTPSRVDSGQPSETEECSCVPYYLCKNNTIIKDGFGLIDIRIKEGPCESYFDICCGEENKIDEPITPRPPVIERPTGCGFRNPEGVGFRITGAADGEAQFAEFPWMVAILREEAVEGSTNKLNVYQCGGSLIHPKAVLTAAHCVTGRNLGKRYKVRAGEWDTQTKNEVFQHQDRDVETIITHDHFRSGTLYNDVALLILKEPVEIAENVDVVCLPPIQQVIDTQNCFTSGWGKDVFGKEGKYQVILKKVEMPMVRNDKCQELLRNTRLGKHFELHRSFVCAGGEQGKDACKGDGGSPLVCPIPGTKDRYQQAGIVAWGIGCGENGTPGVYANVAELRGWIDEQMEYQRLNMSSYKY